MGWEGIVKNTLSLASHSLSSVVVPCGIVATVTRKLMQTNKSIQSNCAFAIPCRIHKYILDDECEDDVTASHNNVRRSARDSVDLSKWDKVTDEPTIPLIMQ